MSATALCLSHARFRLFFLSTGRIRCRFGEYDWGISTWGRFTNSTHIVCEKPAFPDDTRELLGEVSLYVSPNGQCFTRMGCVR